MRIGVGEIRMRILSKTEDTVECEVLTPGKLGSRRHINLPGVKVSLPALTSKDLADVKVGLDVGVDFIALSFVREARDVQQLRAVIEAHSHRPLIIAKIEDQQAVSNLDAIVATADGIMVARGDLGIECPFEELPVIQRRAVRACLAQGRPVIVATHMLESMISQPVPTRAEITDVANAVYEQADAVMLNISADIPIGARRLCDSDNLSSVVVLSTMRAPGFGKDYGVVMVDGAMAGLMSRAVLVLDRENKVVYAEQVPEIAQEPDYKAIMEALDKA